MEEEFIKNQERLKPQDEKNEEERSKVLKLTISFLGVSSVNCRWVNQNCLNFPG